MLFDGLAAAGLLFSEALRGDAERGRGRGRGGERGREKQRKGKGVGEGERENRKRKRKKKKSKNHRAEDSLREGEKGRERGGGNKIIE